MILYDYQLEAIQKMKNGCILCGGVGSGKSITALAYYFLLCGGKLGNDICPMSNPKDLFIITTAMKRDKKEWEGELAHFNMSPDAELNYYKNRIIVDSWNNIKKYQDEANAFFIFDEQRLVGSGAWVKAFYKIAKKNSWILLSATPGDKWSDYIPVFVANGFYKNRTEFLNTHAVYNRYSKYPQIDKYLYEGILMRHKNDILVNMNFKRQTKSHHIFYNCNYNLQKYRDILRKRWNPWTNEPIKNATEYCYCLRRVSNEDESRMVKCLEIAESHPRLIIFYNFDYELDILKNLAWMEGTDVKEWNGHKHEPLPKGRRWIYLVQYASGSEGWNCISTDAMIFYSQNYSYRAAIQAAGRIDRANTPYDDLYYYHLYSKSSIDLAIRRALDKKKEFNERSFTGEAWQQRS